MMDEKMRKAYEAWWEKQRNDALPPTDYEIIEWTLNYLRSQQEPVAFAKDGALFWHGAYKHGVSCDLYAAPQPAAAGEEIMVNAAHDVYTLPLQPSGLSSGPRFVVHVPPPEPQAAQAPQPSLMDGATYRCRKCGEQNEIMLNSARIVTRLQDGSPRDPRDIESDPAGTLIHDPDKPLHAAPSLTEKKEGLK